MSTAEQITSKHLGSVPLHLPWFLASTYFSVCQYLHVYTGAWPHHRNALTVSFDAFKHAQTTVLSVR